MPAVTFTVQRAWLGPEGDRLDASAYGEGGLQARHRIRHGRWSSRPLGEVANLFSGARFARTYVSDPDRGVPYLTGSDMLLADLSGLLYLSKAKTPQMKALQVHREWTLISCSGTVGRTVYVRDEMDGMALSHDVIRCVPTDGSVLPGYLFAFLSSQPAQAMMRQRAYGSVVQHIEPHHIRDLPIAVVDQSDQRQIQDLIAGSARARTDAVNLLDEASRWFDDQLTAPTYRKEHARAVGVVRSGSLAGRLDAFHHVGWAAEEPSQGDFLGDLARVSRPGIIKRIFVQRGTPFISGIDVFQVRPTSRNRIMTLEADRGDALVTAGQILVQRSGQRYGLLGRPAYVGRRLHGSAASEDLMRISPADPSIAGRVFAYLRSDYGRRALLRMSYGTSIPHFNQEQLARVRIPMLPLELLSSARQALALREQADALEQQAISEVERWLA
jgi:type I restriction enzyme, S subunit